MSRFRVAFLAPFEMLLCIVHGAWIGATDGVRNVRGAWKSNGERLEP